MRGSLCSRLDDVDILAAHRLVDLDHRLPVGLVIDAAAAKVDVQVPGIGQHIGVIVGLINIIASLRRIDTGSRALFTLQWRWPGRDARSRRGQSSRADPCNGVDPVAATAPATKMSAR